VFERTTRSGIDAPIMTAVYELLHAGKSPRAAVQDLMTRSPKHERA
jgi:glycerol-3-phosphate dehydrogenase (NAD(P)+)